MAIRIGVFGAGSIGCYIGGRLATAGADVVLLGRARVCAEIEEHGLSLSDLNGWRGRVEASALTVSTDPACLADADIVLVCVKSRDTEEAGRTLAPIVRPDAVIVSLQNGVSNEDRLSADLSGREVLAGMVPFNVARLEDGTYHQGTQGELINAESARLRELLSPVAERAGLAVHFRTNMKAVLWGKLLMNLNNAINMLSGQPLKAQLSQRAYRQCLALCMSEALSVVKAAGEVKPAAALPIPLDLLPALLRTPDFIFKRLAQRMLAIDPKARSSMADDLAAGRAPEIDWINGEITALAARIGVAAPMNARMIELVKEAFAAKECRPLSGAALLADLRAV